MIAACGALAVALSPKLAFMSGGINADALLFTASAFTLLAMARLLRHGLSTRRALFLGLALLVGLLAKPLFVALLLPAFVALGIAVLRARDRPWRQRLVPVAIALGVALVPVVLYSVIAGAVADHPYFSRGTTAGVLAGEGAKAAAPSRLDQLSYVWQLYLPRVPVLMGTDYFPAATTLRDVWANGFIGSFGWTDYGFSLRVIKDAFRLLLLVGLLAGAALIVRRRSWRGRRVELLVYVFAVVCVAGTIGIQDFRAQQLGTAFRQGRYLLPLAVLYGGLIAVAARLFGRRLGPYVGTLAVGVAAIHLLAALLLTVSRYYV